MVTFRTSVVPTGAHAAAIEVPADVVEALGVRTPVPVRVRVGAETYSATVNRRGDGFRVRMGERHRAAAGVRVGDEVEVTLTHEPGRREVAVPDDLARALADAGARDAFDALAWSHRKEHARAVEEAKTPATRERRVARVVEKVLEKLRPR